MHINTNTQTRKHANTQGHPPTYPARRPAHPRTHAPMHRCTHAHRLAHTCAYALMQTRTLAQLPEPVPSPACAQVCAQALIGTRAPAHTQARMRTPTPTPAHLYHPPARPRPSHVGKNSKAVGFGHDFAPRGQSMAEEFRQGLQFLRSGVSHGHVLPRASLSALVVNLPDGETQARPALLGRWTVREVRAVKFRYRPLGCFWMGPLSSGSEAFKRN